jgi:hypothetical protein
MELGAWKLRSPLAVADSCEWDNFPDNNESFGAAGKHIRETEELTMWLWRTERCVRVLPNRS